MNDNFDYTNDKKGNFFSNITKKFKDSKNKKKIILFSIIGVAVIAIVLVLCLYIIPEFIVPRSNLNKATEAFDKADYAVAVDYYKKSGFQNEPENIDKYTYAVAMTQYADGDYKKAVKTFSKANGILDSNDKILECGISFEEKEDYQNAIECFELISTNDASIHKSYCQGRIEYKNKNYDGAASQFERAGDYSDAKTYVTACSLMKAEKILANGELNNAKTAYSKLPADFSFDGISVADRLKALNDASALASVCGKWVATKNYIESRNVYKRNGDWDAWYIDEVIDDQTLNISCHLNSDGTFDISVDVYFYRYTDYSSLSAYCEATQTVISFGIDNVKEFPASYKIDDNTTLKYSNGSFTLDYNVRDDYSANFYNVYKSSVTYGQKTLSY